MVLLGFDLNSLRYIAASFFATYCSGLTHPLDVIKTRLQSHDGKASNCNLVPKYASLGDAFKCIYRDEGFRGLFKGFYISLICQASSLSLFFWVYEVRKGLYESRGMQKMKAVTLSSIEASVAATIVTQPLWVVKTRMLLNVSKGVSEFQNCRLQVLEIYRQHGLHGFGKGLQLSLILSSTGVIQMYLYESAKVFYQGLGIPEAGLFQKHFICGALSKIISVLWSYPITTIRTRIQQNQFVNNMATQKYVGSMDILRHILREEGVSGLFKGLSANVMRGVGQKGIYFSCYQFFKKMMVSREARIQQ